jgi:hypothetical protein
MKLGNIHVESAVQTRCGLCGKTTPWTSYEAVDRWRCIWHSRRHHAELWVDSKTTLWQVIRYIITGRGNAKR